MGQQQLLLLVLGIVIVGIAVVAGIQAFSEGKNKATQDAAISDAMRIVSDVQAWKLKPVAFGGGDNGTAADFAGVTMNAIGIDMTKDAGTDANKYETVNGCYTLTGAAAGATLTIFKRVNGACEATSLATVAIKGTGTTNADISWSYTSGS